MNMKEFHTFAKKKNINKVTRTNVNYPRRKVDYSFSNKKDSYNGKLSQRTFIGLINKGTLKISKKKKVNDYSYKYVYDVKKPKTKK